MHAVLASLEGGVFYCYLFFPSRSWGEGVETQPKFASAAIFGRRAPLFRFIYLTPNIVPLSRAIIYVYLGKLKKRTLPT